MRAFKDLKIAVAGTGYVGLSIATLLSQHHDVTAVDVIPEKVDKINRRVSPIQDEYIEKYFAEKELRLTATLDGRAAYRDADFVVIAAPTSDLQAFLRLYYPQYHLVKDRSRNAPASITNAVMQPFMTVLRNNPERVTFLRDPFEKFARDHVKLRVLTGIFAGYEGYIVRIDRDRQLVFDFGGHAVALRGIHKEDFEEERE